MDSKALRTFLHVAELGSMSKAAERLQLTQPALSRQIKQLEQQAGSPLLKRTGRGVTLTEAGQLLATRGQQVINELEAIDAELAAMQGEIRGDLCIGFPPTVGARLAGPALEKFHRLYPGVKLKVVQLLSGALEQKLLEGRLHLGVLFDGALSANLRCRPLYQEQLSLISHPEASETIPKEINANQLFELPLILPRTPHGLRSMLERLAFRENNQLSIAIEVDSLMIQIEMVRRNLGHTILPTAVVAPDIESGRLMEHKIVKPGLQRTVVLAWSKDHPLTPAGQAMAEQVQQQSTALINLDNP